MTSEAIQTFFDHYVDAFSRRDIDAVMSLWTFPATITTPAGSFVFDEPAFRTNTEALCRFYDRQGTVEARKRVSGIHELSPAVATVTTEDELYDEEGSLIAAWRHGYVLRETAQGIRAIVAVADAEIEGWAARGTPLGS
ncbi:MAG TPA: hypothetical protein VMS43_02680 [Allosphingosinicella sp.]|nr:hypothetical protein [Allosphingosinicella sp.]